MGKHAYLNGKSETPHVWTRHSRRPKSRGCGRLSARWRLATRPHGAARLRRQRGRNDAAFTDTGCSGRLQASLLRLPFSRTELGPFGSRAQCRGTARTPQGPGARCPRGLAAPVAPRTCRRLPTRRQSAARACRRRRAAMVSQHGILLADNIISDHFGLIVSVRPPPSPPSLPAVPRTLAERHANALP